MNATIGWVLVAIIVIVGAFYVVRHNNSTSDSMKQEDATMIDAKTGDTMKASSTDSMMKDESGDAMMKDDQGDTMKSEGSMAMEGENMMKQGSYEAYAPEKLTKAHSGDVVLFFRASWCPTCKAVDTDIRAHLSEIPSGLTILDVNYDTSATLKQKYGVTYQHTFVQVKADGTLIKKWSGSSTLAALLAEVQ